MVRLLSITLLVGLAAGANSTFAQAPAGAPAAGTKAPARAPTPARDPHSPGYVTAKELADGAVPAPNADGNFIIGPTHTAAAELTVKDGVPQGTVYNFTMESTDSKIYPGIARGPAPGEAAPAPAAPGAPRVIASHAAP